MFNINSDKQNPGLAFGRIFFGLWWLYEVVLGHNWKWGNPEWVGEGAGAWLAEDITSAIAKGTWSWAEWLLEIAVVPHVEIWSYVVLVLQVAIAISFITGLFVRPTASVGLAHMFIMFLMGHSRIPPFFVVGFLFVLATKAGMHYGLDRWIADKFYKTRSIIGSFILSLIDKPCPDWLRTHVGIPFATVFAVYFLLQAAAAEAVTFRMAGLDLAVMSGLVAAGFALVKKVDTIPLITRLLSMFVGYKFLHEIWIRFPAALNGLPGWSSGQELTEVLTIIATNHWSFIASIVDTVFIPYAGAWALVFAVVQTAVGIMLIINWKTKQASQLGIGYLVLLLLLGFTRYVPFVLGILIITYALKWGIHLSRHWLGLSVIAVLLFSSIAAISGITPGDYLEHMGSVVAVMLAMLALAFAITAYIQQEYVE
ncbi:MAG: hypothetical protein WD335_00565 [Candidatus Paceibacterota bacterium]